MTATLRVRASHLKLIVTPPDRMRVRHPVNRGPRRRYGLHAHECPADAGHLPTSVSCGASVPLLIMVAVRG